MGEENAKIHMQAIETVCSDAFEAFGLFNGMADGAICFTIVQLPYTSDWDPSTRFKINIHIYSQHVYKVVRVLRTAKAVDDRFITSVRQKLFALLSVMDFPGCYNYEEE